MPGWIQKVLFRGNKNKKHKIKEHKGNDDHGKKIDKYQNIPSVETTESYLYDDFPRNNVDGFDLVPTSTLSPQIQSGISEPSNAINNQPNNGIINQPNKVTPISKRPEQVQKTEVEVDSVESIIDIVTAKADEELEVNDTEINAEITQIDKCDSPRAVVESTEVMGDPGSSDLSIDEMETLDMFDSMLNDVENDSDSISEADITEVEGNNNSNNNLETNPDDPFTTVEKKLQAKIDYSKVIGENLNQQETSEEIIIRKPTDNWKLKNWSNLDFTRQKSGRIIPKSQMYLPSPELQRDVLATAPELPPADYPEYESEDQESLCASEASSFIDVVSVTSREEEEKITSFSSVSLTEIYTTTQNIGENGISPTSPVRNKKTLTSSTKSSRNSSTSGSPRPRRPRPRVTSFKALNLPPKLSSEPVNNLVKKFEKIQDASF